MANSDTTKGSAENSVIDRIRDFFFAMLHRGELEEIRSLASFIVNGVLISNKVVIDLVTLYSAQNESWRALDPIAKEERFIISERLNFILENQNNLSFIDVESRGLEFTLRFLTKSELEDSNLEMISVTVSTDPVCTLILISYNNTMTYALRLVTTGSEVPLLAEAEKLFIARSQ